MTFANVSRARCATHRTHLQRRTYPRTQATLPSGPRSVFMEGGSENAGHSVGVPAIERVHAIPLG
jgi:hypothetical protein